MSIKTASVLILAVVAATLTYQFVNRLSVDALNMAVGVLCGMAASVPISLGLMLALLRDRGKAETEGADEAEPKPQRYPAPRPQLQPQIIVVAPPNGQYSPQYNYGPGAPAGYAYPLTADENTIDARDWRIIGEDS